MVEEEEERDVITIDDSGGFPLQTSVVFGLQTIVRCYSQLIFTASHPQSYCPSHSLIVRTV